MTKQRTCTTAVLIFVLSSFSAVYAAEQYDQTVAEPLESVREEAAHPWLSIEIESLFLFSDFGQQSIGYALNDDPGNNALASFGSVTDTERLSFSPRLTVAYKCDNGWGLRSRFFHMETHNHGAVPPLNPALVFATGSSGFRAYTVDLEVTRAACFGNWDLVGSLGARHGSISYDQQLHVTADLDLGGGAFASFPGSSISMSDAKGTGLTFALSGVRPVNCNWGLFWNLRGSALWGPVDAYAFTSASASSAGAYGFSNNLAFGSEDTDLWIGEAQLGVQCSYDLPCCGAVAFLRLTGEFQSWSADQVTAVSGSTATIGGTATNVTSAQASGIDADLFGFGVSAELNW